MGGRNTQKAQKGSKMPTLTAPKQELDHVDIAVTMNQAFALSDLILMLDKNSYDYKQLREIGRELHEKAKNLHK